MLGALVPVTDLGDPLTRDCWLFQQRPHSACLALPCTPTTLGIGAGMHRA